MSSRDSQNTALSAFRYLWENEPQIVIFGNLSARFVALDAFFEMMARSEIGTTVSLIESLGIVTLTPMDIIATVVDEPEWFRGQPLGLRDRPPRNGRLNYGWRLTRDDWFCAREMLEPVMTSNRPCHQGFDLGHMNDAMFVVSKGERNEQGVCS